MSTYDTITLSWQPGFDGGFTDTRYQVQYRHGNELQSHYFDCGGNTKSCNITGKKTYIYIFKNLQKSLQNYEITGKLISKQTADYTIYTTNVSKF